MQEMAVEDRSPEGKDPRWNLEEGDEIVPGRSVLRFLGGGYRYDAYLAFDQHMHCLVVCKVVRPHLIDDERTLSGLAGEVEMLARLSHPVILRGFDAVLDGPRPHLVLEHLEGPRLSSLVRRYGPLPAEQLVPLGVQLSSAVHYLTNQGLVHLDIKPSNTIMGAPPRMIDLSVALTVEQAHGLRSHVGTDAYMAPEQCAPERLGPVGPAADVWGLGVTLYRAACGELPYSKPSAGSDVPEERWPQLVEPAASLKAQLDPAIKDAIMRCLAYDAKARPTPVELAEDLESVLGGSQNLAFEAEAKTSLLSARLDRRWHNAAYDRAHAALPLRVGRQPRFLRVAERRRQLHRADRPRLCGACSALRPRGRAAGLRGRDRLRAGPSGAWPV